MPGSGSWGRSPTPSSSTSLKAAGGRSRPPTASHFAGEVPQLDPAEFCGGELNSTFALDAAGTWPDAPLPGEEDASILVRTLQQPSCGNGLKGIVQLFDDGGDGRFRSTAELILHAYYRRQLVAAELPRDRLRPQP